VVLLDTNVISELMRPACDRSVLMFVNGRAPASLFTAAVCEAELRYGLARLPLGARRRSLEEALSQFLAAGLSGRVLPFDSRSAQYYAEIRATRDAAGRPITSADAMIAATARAYGAIIATRDAGGFAGCGVDILDPWTAQ